MFSGGNIVGNACGGSGGGIYVFGKFYQQGGNIIGNAATYYSANKKGWGGGIQTKGTSSLFQLESGNVLDNYSWQGGGAINNDGNVVMTGGLISNNHAASSSGGGVRSWSATASFVMTGGVISGNYGDSGGGCSIDTGASVTLGGTCQIINNKSKDGTISCNFYLGDNGSGGPVYFNVAEGTQAPRDGMRVFVTTKTLPTEGQRVQIANASSADAADYVYSDDGDNYYTQTDDNILYLKYGTRVIRYRGGSASTWVLNTSFEDGWNDAIAASTGSSSAKVEVELLADWSAGGSTFGNGDGFTNGTIWVPSAANIELKMNGKSIDRGLSSATANGRIFTVDGTLVIGNATTDGGEITGGYSTTGGGGILVGANSSSSPNLTINNNVNVTGNKTQSSDHNNTRCGSGGGGIKIDRGTFNLAGGKISSNSLTNTFNLYSEGGGVLVKSGSTFNMISGVIGGDSLEEGNKAYSSDGVAVGNNATFNLTGGEIKYNSPFSETPAYTGGGVGSYGTFNFSGGKISNNKNHHGGGIWCVRYSESGVSKTTISKNAIISDNSAIDRAGGVYCHSGGVVEFQGGEISNNSSKYGGGVVVHTDKDISGTYFKMTGGEIKNNTANSTETGGGGVEVDDASNVTVSADFLGGTIDNNTTAFKGAGICVNSVGVTVGGTFKCTDNVGSASKGNVYIADDKTIKMSTTTPLATGAEIGVLPASASSYPTFTTGTYGTDNSQYFYCDSEDPLYAITTVSSSDNNLKLADAVLGVKGSSDSRYSYYEGWNKGWTKAAAKYSSTLANVDVKLVGACTATSTVALTGGTYTFDTNGNTATAAENARMFALTNVGFTLNDSSGSSGKLAGNGTVADNGGCFLINSTSTSTITINGTTIDGFTVGDAYKAGAIYITGSGWTFNMAGGTISNNTAGMNGGAICAEATSTSAGTLNMTGGTISTNKSTSGNGGGVDVGQYVTFNLSDGTISGNSATNGGGISTTSSATIPSTLAITGGTISGNTATNNGGGISTTTGATLTVSDGTISDNTATINGGGIDLECTATITGGSITSNAAGESKFGAGVYYGADGVLTLGGTASITGNNDSSSKGDLYLTTVKCATVSSTVPLAEGASIGVLTQTDPTTGNAFITNASSSDYHAYFTSNNTEFSAINEGTGTSQRVKLSAGAIRVRVGDAQNTVSDTNAGSWQSYSTWDAALAQAVSLHSSNANVDVQVLEDGLTVTSPATFTTNAHSVDVDLHGHTVTRNYSTNRVFLINSGAVLNIFDETRDATKTDHGAKAEGKFKDNGSTANYYGGFAYIEGTSTSSLLNISDITIDGFKSCYSSGAKGGAIFSYCASMTFTDVTFSNNYVSSSSGSSGGAIYVTHTSSSKVPTVNINGSLFSGNYIYCSSSSSSNYCYGAAICLDGVDSSSSATLNTKNTTFKGNYGNCTVCHGGALSIKGTANLQSGTIITQNTGSDGGAFRAQQKYTTVNISDGVEISRNVAKAGGSSLTGWGNAFCLGDNATCNMNGGDVFENNGSSTSYGNSDAIHVQGGSHFNFYGGSVHNNSAKIGGGIGMNSSQNVCVGGTAKIYDNTIGGVTKNLYVPSGQILAFNSDEPLTEGADIHVTADGSRPVTITATTSSSVAKYFHSDSEGDDVGENASHAVMFGTALMQAKLQTSEDWQTYFDWTTGWSVVSGFGAASDVKLLKDYTMTQTLSLSCSYKVAFDMAGHTITAPSSDPGDSLFSVQNMPEFKVFDSTATGEDQGARGTSKIQGKSTSYSARCFYVNSTSTTSADTTKLYLNDINIKDFYVEGTVGSAIYINQCGSAYLDHATCDNDDAKYTSGNRMEGAAIAAWNYSYVNVANSQLINLNYIYPSGGTGGGYGVAVGLKCNANCDLSTTLVKNCETPDDGILAASSTSASYHAKLTIHEGVEITDNECLNGILIAMSGGEVSIEGGEIHGNTTTWDTVSTWGESGSTINITGGSIYDNWIGNSYCSAVRLQQSNQFLTLGGSAKIYGNKNNNGTTECNYYVNGSNLASVSTTPFTSDAKIGVTTSIKPTATTNVNVTSGSETVKNSSHFYSDSSTYAVTDTGTTSGSYRVVLTMPAIQNWDYTSSKWVSYALHEEGWQDVIAGKEGYDFGGGSSDKPIKAQLLKTWEATSGSFGSGAGFGTSGNIDTSNKYIELDLNGNNIDRKLTAAQADGYVVNVASGASLKVDDSKSSSVTNYFSADSTTGAWVKSSSTTDLYVTGGYITGGNNSSGNGGGIKVADSATLNIANANVVGNLVQMSAYDINAGGGGVFAAGGATSGAQVTLDGGAINGNAVYNTTSGGGQGAGVYVASNAIFAQESGSVNSNRVTNGKGGGIFAKGSATIKGNVESNTAQQDSQNANCEANGGGIAAYGAGTLNVEGSASITGNYSKSLTKIGGAGVWLGSDGSSNTSPTFNMSAGSITANYTSEETIVGAGVYADTSNISLSGTASITGNGLATKKGNLYLAKNGDYSHTLNVTDPSDSMQIGVMLATTNGMGIFSTATADDYSSHFTSDVSYIVNRRSDTCLEITNNISIKTTEYNKAYDASLHGSYVELDGQYSGAVIKYGTEEGSYTLDTYPTWKNAGTYYTYYKVTAPGYLDATGKLTTVISKATPTADQLSVTLPSEEYSASSKQATVVAASDVEGLGTTISVSYYSGTSTEAMTSLPYDVGEYNFKVNINEGTNYKATEALLTSDKWKFSITPVALTVTWKNYLNLTYDGNEKNVTADVSGYKGSDANFVTPSYENNTGIDAGDYTAILTLSGDPITKGNYSYTTDDKNKRAYTIAKKLISFEYVSGKVSSRVYDATCVVDKDASKAASAVGINGICSRGTIEDEVYVDEASVLYTTKNVGQNKSIYVNVSSLAGDQSANYTFTKETLTFTTDLAITVKYIDITYTDPSSWPEYDGTEKMSTISAAIPEGEIYEGDECSVSIAPSTTGDDKTSAGEHSVTATITNNDYKILDGKLKHTYWILQKAVTVSSVDVQNKDYDGQLSATFVSAAMSGVIDGDKSNVTLNYSSVKYEDKNAAADKNVVIEGLNLTGTKASNYSLASTTATCGPSKTGGTYNTIAPKSVTLSWFGYDTRKYDTTMSNVRAQASGALDGDVISVVVNGGTEKNAGEHTATATKLVDAAGVEATNYQISSLSESTKEYIITKATLNAAYRGGNVIYNTTLPEEAKKVDLTGFIGTDTQETAVTQCPTMTFEEPYAVGTYTLTPNNDGKSTNYDFNLIAGTLNVKSKEFDWISGNDYKADYDGDSHSISVKCEEVGVTVDITYYKSKEDAESKTDPSSTPTTYKDVTDTAKVQWYRVEATGYEPYIASNIVQISKKKVTYNATALKDSRVYDATTDAKGCVGLVLDGVVSGDTLNVDADINFENANVGENKSIKITNAVLSGSSVGNYELDSTQPEPTTTFKITHKTLTYSWVGAETADLTYTGLQKTITVNFDGVCGSDDLGVLYNGNTATHVLRGESAKYTAKATINNSNYVIQDITGSTISLDYNITPAFLRVQYPGETVKKNSGGPKWPIVYSGFVNGEDPSVEGKVPQEWVAPSINTTCTEGTNEEKTPEGGSANDYDFTYVSGWLLWTEANPMVLTYSSYIGYYDGRQHGKSIEVKDTSGTTISADKYSLKYYSDAEMTEEITDTNKWIDANYSSTTPQGMTVYVKATATEGSGYADAQTQANVLIYPKELTFTWPDTKSFEYDSEAHIIEPSIPSDQLVTREGEKDVCTAIYSQAAQTEVGNYEVSVSGVTNSNYTPKRLDATLSSSYSITKHKVTLTSATSSREYNGQPYTDSTVTPSHSTGTAAFYKGDPTYNVTGTITDVGSTPNTFTYTWAGTDDESNYEITLVTGTLTVTPYQAQINVSIKGNTNNTGTESEPKYAEYDRTEHSVSGYEIEITDAGGKGLYSKSNVALKTESKGKDTAKGTLAYKEGETLDYALYTSSLAVDDFEYLNANFANVSLTVDRQVQCGVAKRKIELTSYGTNKMYDGSALTNPSLRVTDGSFAADASVTEEFVYTDWGTITNWCDGGVDNVFTCNNNTATGKQTDVRNYKITQIYEKLVINKRDVVITSQDATQVYNGQALANTTPTVKGSGFATGEGATYSNWANITNVQGTGEESVTNTFTYTLNSNTSANNYTITQNQTGKLKITRRPVTITSKDDSKVYDGTALTKNEVEISGEGFVTGQGATYSWSGSATDVADTAEGNNTFEYTPTSATVANNYNITKVCGTLTITRATPSADLFVAKMPADSQYDAKAHTVTKFSFDTTKGKSGMGSISAISYSSDNGQTWANEAKNAGSYIIKVKIEQGDNFSAYDGLKDDAWKFNILKRKATAQSANQSWEYDGSTHTCDKALTWSEGAFPEESSESFKPEYTNSVTHVIETSHDNTFNLTATGGALIDNYDITKQTGSISITARPITLESVNGEWTYDGSSHSTTGTGYENPVSDYRTDTTPTQKGFVKKEGATYSAFATVKDVADSPKDNTFSYELFSTSTETQDKTLASDYTITPKYGSVKIKPVSGEYTIHVVGKTAETKVYDAEAVTVTGYDYKDVPDHYDTAWIKHTGNESITSADAGEHKMGLTAGQFVNTNSNFADIKFEVDKDSSFEITKRPITFTGKSAIDTEAKTFNHTIQDVQGVIVQEYDPTHPETQVGLLTNKNHKLDETSEGHLSHKAQGYDVGTWDGSFSGTEKILDVSSGKDVTTNYATPTKIVGKIQINRKAAKITADNLSKTYGDTDPVLTYTISEVYEGDSIAATSVTRESGEDYCAEGESQQHKYIITPAGDTEQGNYAVTYVNGEFTINKREATLTGATKNLTYSGDTQGIHGITLSNRGFSDELVYDEGPEIGSDLLSYTAQGKDVKSDGSAYIGEFANKEKTKITDGGSPAVDKTQNYTFNYVEGSLTIDKKGASITAESKTKIYGESDPELTVKFDGLVESEKAEPTKYISYTIARDGAGTYAGEDVPENPYAIRITNISSLNYNVSHLDSTFNITARSIKFTGDSAAEPITYDGSTHTYTGITSEKASATTGSRGLIGNQYLQSRAKGTTTSLAYTLTGRNVGTHTGIFDGTPIIIDPDHSSSVVKSANYSYEYEVGSMTISQCPVTVTAINNSKTYGDNDPELSADVTGYVEGEKSLISYSLSREEGEDVFVGSETEQHKYVITASGETSQGNYTVSYEPAEFTINQRSIDIIGSSAEATYDGKEHSVTSIERPTKLLSGHNLVNGIGSITYKAAGTTVVEPGPVYRGEFYNVGDTKIKDSAGNEVQRNYTWSTPTPGTMTINPCDVTVTADNKTMTYGDTEPSYTVSYRGLVGSESPEYSISRVQGIDVGTYDINVTGDEYQGNYKVSYVKGSLTINKRDIVLIGDTAEKIYSGGEQYLRGITIFNPGPKVQDKVGNGVSYEAAGKLVNGTKFQTKTQYDGVFSPSTVPESPTNFIMDANNRDVSFNYNITYQTGYLKITTKPVTISPLASSKAYSPQDPDPTFVADVDGVFPVDTITYNLLRTDPSNQNVGTYTIYVEDTVDNPIEELTETNSNYSYTLNTNIYTITKLAAYVTANNQTYLYTGSEITPQLTATVIGEVVPGEVTYNLAVSPGGTKIIDPGSYTVVASGDIDQTNYTVTFNSGVINVGLPNKSYVNFDMNKHGTSIAQQELNFGSKVTKPTDPSASGYTFKGWYKEPSCVNAWNFDIDTANEANITLYAKWEEAKVCEAWQGEGVHKTYNTISAAIRDNPRDAQIKLLCNGTEPNVQVPYTAGKINLDLAGFDYETNIYLNGNNEYADTLSLTIKDSTMPTNDNGKASNASYEKTGGIKGTISVIGDHTYLYVSEGHYTMNIDKYLLEPTERDAVASDDVGVTKGYYTMVGENLEEHASVYASDEVDYKYTIGEGVAQGDRDVIEKSIADRNSKGTARAINDEHRLQIFKDAGVTMEEYQNKDYTIVITIQVNISAVASNLYPATGQKDAFIEFSATPSVRVTVTDETGKQIKVVDDLPFDNSYLNGSPINLVFPVCATWVPNEVLHKTADGSKVIQAFHRSGAYVFGYAQDVNTVSVDVDGFSNFRITPSINYSNVTYKPNFDSDQADYVDAKIAGERAALDCMYHKSGQRFVEWNTLADGAGKSYKPEDTINVNSELSLYAIWEDVVYDVNIAESLNGRVTANVSQAKMGDTVTLSAVPDENAEFVNYYIDGLLEVDNPDPATKPGDEEWKALDRQVTTQATFTMTPNDVTVGGDFKLNEYAATVTGATGDNNWILIAIIAAVVAAAGVGLGIAWRVRKERASKPSVGRHSK